MNLEWMRDICDFGEDLTSKQRRFVGEPWTILRDGEPWSMATDGRAMVMVKGDVGFSPIDDYPRESVLGLVNSALLAEPRFTATVDALKKWCGEHPLFGECDHCAGTGKGVRSFCGRDGADCEECGGDGREHFDPEPGTICGVNINKRLLWRVIKGLDSGMLRFAHGGDKAVIRGDGLLVIIMARNPDIGESCSDEFRDAILEPAP